MAERKTWVQVQSISDYAVDTAHLRLCGLPRDCLLADCVHINGQASPPERRAPVARAYDQDAVFSFLVKLSFESGNRGTKYVM